MNEETLCGKCNKLKGKEDGCCKCGRPTSYSEEILNKTKEYKENWQSIFPEDKLPTIEGLSLYISINRSTIYDWISQVDNEELQEFSNIVEEILAKQGKTLVNKGLANEFNASITKVMMSKHGYKEANETDLTSKGEVLQPILVKFIDGKTTDDNRNTTGV